ncbi:MAG: M1 family metallopeptidase [Schleiferiaceae bacterium]|nr:M1 family metallopeptidase [Schleiferiaceae bacterium]
MNRIFAPIISLFFIVPAFAQENVDKSAFRQMYDLLPTPNTYRSASGAPGHQYYQQQADYVMDIVLDDKKQRISGTEQITYHNNSPDALAYLWLQLDQNMRHPESMTNKMRKYSIQNRMEFGALERMHRNFDGGFDILKVQQGNKDLPHTINNTMMRVDLPTPLAPGAKFTFTIEWAYNVQERALFGGRSGYEYFPAEDNYLYTIAQFFPRMAVYDDIEGWQHKQFLGSGEFALTFGNYKVNITVPEDHVVSATGTLSNANQVLTSEQRKRYADARKSFDKPVFIITPEEALEAEQKKQKGTKTWRFEAKNVRDFAFASSRKFIWDAMAVQQSSGVVMAESLYPKEGNPLWEQYSTRVVAHTLKTYSKFTFDYPYEKAVSVHTDRIGMEYPMICFNGGRPESDGTYSEATKYGMISVIIHEVGHNYFPMIVNSDERQWTWMDEGLTTFLQYLTEKEWDRDYPVRRGPPAKIVDYMKGDKSKMVPIMTNSESVLQLGNNAYGKAATGLNILRETILGRELFDHAFKTYANRWMFKHPSPADFFRTMEDASGTDLDWFWRGWFFTTDHVDISIDNVRWYQASSLNPLEEMPIKKEAAKDRYIGIARDATAIEETVVEKDPTMRDFYNKRDPFQPTSWEMNSYYRMLKTLSDAQLDILHKDAHYYEIDFSNIGGLVMPLILEFVFENDSTHVERIPAEIWLKNESGFTKTFIFDEPIKSVELDPFLELADIDRSNNHFPRQLQQSRFQLYKQKQQERSNPMRESLRQDF